MTPPQPYDGRGAQSPPWWPSRYGPGDSLGSANELSAASTLAALKLPQTGEIVELTRVIHSDIPAYPPRRWTINLLAHETLEGMRDPDSESDFGAFEEVVTQSYQLGCHLDALGHVSIAGRGYNGTHYREFFSPTGLVRLGIENAPTWLCRGVLLDVSAIAGGDHLEPGFIVTPDHLASAAERAGVEVVAGDAVLIHTGWGDLWDDPDQYSSGEPGIGWDAAHWLSERHPSLIGADTWGVEVIPGENPRRPFVVHQHLIVETGTYLLENVDTSVLAARGVSEFLFVLAPVRSRGASASVVSPVAVL